MNIDSILSIFIIPIIFNIVFYFRDGQTIGDKIMKTRLVDEKTGKKPSTGQLFGRFFAKIISGLLLGIGYMQAGWKDEKKALHDGMSGIRYVETKQYGGWITTLVVVFSLLFSIALELAKDVAVDNIITEMYPEISDEIEPESSSFIES